MGRIALILVLIFVISCDSKREKNESQTNERPKIAVVNYPLYYFATAIAGNLADIYLPVIDGDPAYWNPSAEHVSDFQNADLILANGAGYAKWMEKVSLPSSKIVNSSIGFKNQWIELAEGVEHVHGAEGKHAHKGTAFTTWLNFKLATKQAEAIFKALNELIPNHSDELLKNFEHLKASLSDLDLRMEAISKELAHRRLIASHPVYQYMEAGYGLNIISEHWEPNEMPTDAQWQDLKDKISRNQDQIMIWEDEPLDEIKSKLDALNVSIVVFNPCGNALATGDFINMMNKNLNQLEQIIMIE